VLIPLAESLRANLVAHALFQMGVPEHSAVGSFLGENLSHAHVLVYGIIIIIVILYMPDGIVGLRLKRARK